MNNIGNINNTKYLLDKYKLTAKISLGQNFLVDEKVIDKIVANMDESDDLAIIEIGPGLGALTEKLLLKCKKLVSIEIDKNMVEILSDTIQDEKFTLIHENILKFDLEELVSELKSQYRDVYLIANLPYYITSDILMSVFKLETMIDQIMVMVQTEFGERLVSKHNTKEYRPLTVVSKTLYKSKMNFNISKNVFYPKPKITSSIVKMNLKEHSITNKEKYIEFVELCFTQKRKTLYNNLKTSLDTDLVLEILKEAKIEENMRPAQLDIADYIRLFEVYDEKEIIR